jgi:3-oxoadipate enol-lactonase
LRGQTALPHSPLATDADVDERPQLAFDDAGGGQPVVLLHGFPFDRSLWREQSELLRNDYRVVTPDLRVHGASEVTVGTVQMEAMAHDVARLMDHLKIEKAIIGGLSMGGYVALAFARMFPERVQGLVLADTRAQADTEEGKQNRAVQAQKAITEGMKPIVEAMLPKLVTAETLVNRPDVVGHVRSMMMKTPPEGAAAALRGMAERQDQRAFLKRIDVPTLVMVGQSDPITPVADSELMNQAIRGSRLKVIDEAAHVSNLEQPDQFNSALVGFLRSVAAD